MPKSDNTTNLVLMRHGQSAGGREHRFAGWTDVGLSRRGYAESERAGKALRAAGFEFDGCHTSVLARARETARVACDGLGAPDLAIETSWRQNERHYGALQEMKRSEVAAKYGHDMVFHWRRDYDARPPALADGDHRLPEFSPLYEGIDRAFLPRTESHRDAAERMLPYWNEVIVPQIRAGKRLLIVSHTASLRGLVKHIESVSDADIRTFKIATAVPLVYELDESLRPRNKYYLSGGLAGRLRLLISRARPNAKAPWL